MSAPILDPASSPSIRSLDVIDTSLLDALQVGLPLVERPFAVLGAAAGLSEEECLARVKVLRHGEPKVIRQISAIFDTTALGYRSALVAARIAPEKLAQAAQIISAHPGVSHNYERAHAFNLWYTLAVPPDSALGLERTVERLRELSGADSMRLLPTLRLFKIGVKFDLGNKGAGGKGEEDEGLGGAFTEADRAIAARHRIGDAEIPAIRVLQRDLPLVERPFDDWAKEAGMGTADLLDAAKRFRERRQMRRFAAVLHHRAAGVKANAMGVWAVPEGRVADVGERLAQFQEVSHCYRRPTYADWPYSVFTMVHARTREEALAALERMQGAAEGARMEALWTVREFKKVRVTYFMPQTQAWERANG